MPISVDGIETFFFQGSVTIPNDPAFGGYDIYAHNEAWGSDQTQDILLGSYTDPTWKAGPFPIDGTTWDLYVVSFDVNNQLNTLLPGTTPRVVGLHPVAQTSGSLQGDRILGGTVAIAAFASTIRPITLASSDPTLPDANYPAGTYYFNTSTHTLKKVAASGSSWELGVNGGTDIIANTITGGQVVAGAISSTELNSTEIKVGGGGSKPGQFGVYDGSNVLIGWIGTNGGNVGAWFKTCRVGGSSYSTAPFQADSSGNLSITGGTIAYTAGTVTVNIDSSNKVKVSDTAANNYAEMFGGFITFAPLSGTSFNSQIGVGNLFFQYGSGGGAVTGVDIALENSGLPDFGSHIRSFNSAGNAISLECGFGSGAFLKINGSQIVSTRQTGPGNTSDTTDVATRFNNLLTALRNHGLIT